MALDYVSFAALIISVVVGVGVIRFRKESKVKVQNLKGWVKRH